MSCRRSLTNAGRINDIRASVKKSYKFNIWRSSRGCCRFDKVGSKKESVEELYLYTVDPRRIAPHHTCFDRVSRGYPAADIPWTFEGFGDRGSLLQ